MRLSHVRRVPAVLVSALAGPALSFTPPDHLSSLEFPLPHEASPVEHRSASLESGPARGVALGSGWTAQYDPRTGVVHTAYGHGVRLAGRVSGEAHAAHLARDLLLARSTELAVEPGNFELRNVAHARGKYAVHYRQVEQGVPVWRASAFVLLAETGELAAFGSDFYPHRPEVLEPARLDEARAIAIATAALGAVPRSDRSVTAEMFLVPQPSGERMELARAYRVVFEASDPLGKWETFVDARSGAVLGRSNLYRFVNVIGNVTADVQDFSYCDGAGLQGMQNLTVSVSGGVSDVTDGAGDFDVPHGGTSSVTVTAQLAGPFADVDYLMGADASFTGTAIPGTAFQLTWDGSNSRPDERDAFFHTNRVREFVRAIDPTFNGLDYPMPTKVGHDTASSQGACPGNAWWDGIGTNYCLPGNGRANTGELGDVVYHEYGHGLTQELYLGNGTPEPASNLHEGNSDVLANFVTRRSTIGLGLIVGACETALRDSDNGLVYPDHVVGNPSGHFAGGVIAGFHWDAWQSMLGTMPAAEADTAAWSAWHFARDLGTPQIQPDQVLWSFLVDDDDGDLTNGTPNYDHFCLGATNHGFTCPTLTSGVFVTHTPVGHTLDGSLGFDVVATITSTVAVLDPSQLFVRYRVNAGPWNEVAMTSTGGTDEYGGRIPAVGPMSEVEYYVSAADLAGNRQESPATAPAATHAFDVAYVYDDLEGPVGGWTAGLPGDDATTGQWELADPIGTAAQPETDSTPGAGTLAFITGQCAGPNCFLGCDLGCNDIDNGTTTLLSPVWDLTGAVAAKVKYDRWYSNDTGADPGQDFWVVEVSNDGGSTWGPVENTSASRSKWTSVTVDITALFGVPDRVRLRFRASDVNPGSLVEAAVDEVRVLAAFGAVGVDESPSASPVALGLSQNQPNPFRPSTRISYGIPARSDVNLTVYNVNGRAVRTLASGPRAAGRYEVRWDGRDGAGARVAAGVYFYRLTAGTGSITKKMTVMQ